MRKSKYLDAAFASKVSPQFVYFVIIFVVMWILTAVPCVICLVRLRLPSELMKSTDIPVADRFLAINAPLRKNPKQISCSMTNFTKWTCSAFRAKSLNDLQRHVKSHKQTVYRCEEPGCEYSAKSMSAFAFHWQEAHNNESKEPKYVCHVCDKRFKRGYYLTKHLIGTHKLQWPSGHSRFRLVNLYRILLTVWNES